MRNQIDYSGFVERYLNQTLEQDDLKWFSEEMEGNPALEEEVQLQKEIGKAILNEETLAFRAQISSLFEEKEAVETVRLKRSYRVPHSLRVAVASLAALVIMGTSLYVYSHRTIPAEQLFESYYEPYESLINVRSSSSQTANLLVSAMQKYEEQNFESALLLFETVLATDDQNITSRFYSGISYLETNRLNHAEKTFASVIDHNDNLYIEHAEWYLGLCYLKTGKGEQARIMFSAIEESDGYYSRKAKRIIRNL